MADNIEILLDSDQIEVYGPPASVEVFVDRGPTGPRGNKIFWGIGSPLTEIPVGTVLAENDLFIDQSGSQPVFWHYLNTPTGFEWQVAPSTSPEAQSDVPVYLQETEPPAPSVWFQTNALGQVIDIRTVI